MTRKTTVALCVAALGLGCQANDENVPAAGPPPVAGGTLMLTGDGQTAIASDPDRASIHVVDLSSREERHRIVLEPGDEPGRAVEGLDGRIHVVLRRAGQLLTLDRNSGAVTERRDVCGAPRGVDVHEESGDLYVACAGGEVVSLPPTGGAPRHVAKLDPDLRDIVVREAEDRLLVSRFRSAELLVVEGGEVAQRLRPPAVDGSFGGGRSMAPTVAWRIREASDGSIFMVHQHSTSSQLGTLGRPALGNQYYGGSCATGVIRSAVTRFQLDGDGEPAVSSMAVEETSLAVDIAIDVDSSNIYLAAAAEPSPSATPTFSGVPARAGVRRIPISAMTPSTAPGCITGQDPFVRGEAAIGVALTPDGELVAQYRDPGQLNVVGATDVGGDTIAMSGGRAEDLGHALFHEAAGTGATCAGCHPEGGDDGHVWQFDVGPRRTQTLTGGILDTAPFHWAGDVPDVEAVMDGTFVGRMGGSMPRQDELDAFGQWVDAIPATPAPTVDRTAAERGAEVFADAGCTGCHSGEKRTNNELADVDTGMMVHVPALYEVAYHAPYLHDGRAPTLHDLLSMHGNTEGLTEAQRDDLAIYLESL